MTIAIDFDGTCVTHEYPNVGKDIGAAPVLKTLVDNGHKLILHTMRGYITSNGDTLTPALRWFEKNGITLQGVNSNSSQKNWTNSDKVYANLYIDDAALGAPLVRTADRPYIDWRLVILELESRGCLFSEDVSRCISAVLHAQSDLALFQ